MSGSEKSEQEHVPHFLQKNVKTTKFLDVSRCSHANQRQGNVQKSVVFHSSGQCHPTTAFCKISVRRSKFCQTIPFMYNFRSSSNHANKFRTIF